MFEKPTKEDFTRILISICEDALALAVQKTHAVQAQFTKSGNLGNSNFARAVAQEILPIHKECVNRALDFVIGFARKSDFSFGELCSDTEKLLISRADAFASLIGSVRQL